MLVAVKNNREYKIQETEKDAYLKANYTIYKENKGKYELVKAPETDKGKLQEENAALKAELEALKETLAKQEAADKANQGNQENVADKKAAK